MRSKKITIRSNTGTWKMRIRKWIDYTLHQRSNSHRFVYNVWFFLSILQNGWIVGPFAEEFTGNGHPRYADGIQKFGPIGRRDRYADCRFHLYTLCTNFGASPTVRCKMHLRHLVQWSNFDLIHLQVKTSHDVCKKAKIPSLGFAETAGKVFECGPPLARKWSNFAQ